MSDVLLSEFSSISPVDGRYWGMCNHLSNIFSEMAVIKYRIKIELYYLVALSDFIEDVPEFTAEEADTIVDNLMYDDILSVKSIEEKIRHDVKAVEVYLQGCLDEKYHPWIHFGLTSQDINSVMYTLQMQDLISDVSGGNSKFMDDFAELLEKISVVAESSDYPMVCFTHGQPATPSTMKDQLNVYSSRLAQLHYDLCKLEFKTKFGGATGGLNAHKIAYPDKEWLSFVDKFLSMFKIERNVYTTQIDHYDNHSNFYNKCQQICTVLIDLCQDIWLYISRGYFKQVVVKDEVGSSTMPHKVNPINFENAEGNLHMAVALFQLLSRKLPISRMQRDLSDSTLIRNVGVAFSHMSIAIQNIIRGLNKIDIDIAVLKKGLEETPELLTEAVQTVMRKNGYTDAYDQMKLLSRGEKLSREKLMKFVAELEIAEDDKERLLALETSTYL